jgi:hypothetical protein
MLRISDLHLSYSSGDFRGRVASLECVRVGDLCAHSCASLSAVIVRPRIRRARMYGLNPGSGKETSQALHQAVGSSAYLFGPFGRIHQLVGLAPSLAWLANERVRGMHAAVFSPSRYLEGRFDVHGEPCVHVVFVGAGHGGWAAAPNEGARL